MRPFSALATPLVLLLALLAVADACFAKGLQPSAVASARLLGGGASCPTQPPFSPRSPWNSQLPEDATLEPSSPAMVSRLVRQVLKDGVGFNTTTWSVPIYTVPSGQPPVRVTLEGSNRYLQEAWANVPLPPDARPSAGTDGHLVVWQPSTDTMWEFWRLQLRDGGWFAGYGGRILDVSANPGYYISQSDSSGRVTQQSWWGATATGLPLVAGLVRLGDVRCGRIDHALALALPKIREGVVAWPAQRSDGDDPNPLAIPEGARLRLDPKLDLSKLGLPPITRMLAEAAQRYGLIVRDGSGSISLYGEDPAPYGSNPWPGLLGGLKPWQFMPKFPWSRLQVVRMRLSSYP
jgi:hypothetical protein